MKPFRDEHERGMGRRGPGRPAVEAPSASGATIWAVNPARLHGFCPCGAQPVGGEARLDTVDFAAGVMSGTIIKPLSTV